jgi:SAM-dependent methyltransferase
MRVGTLVLALAFLALGILFRPAVLKGVLLGVAAIAFLFFVYLRYAYYLFARDGGRLQRKFHQLVIDQLAWRGEGRALDIGTGNGAVAVEVAKRFPAAEVVGVDLWGKPWSYEQAACAQNAASEGVGDRVRFERASAADLPYDGEVFDAVVSNFVFHSVRADDRTELLREALRVLRKGGSFSFQDLFNEQFYHEPDDLPEVLRSWGLEEVRFMRSSDHISVPVPLRINHMVGGAGVLSGTK